MPYDERLAERIRQVLDRRKAVTERKMFGGVAFLLSGNMCCGVIGNLLVVRLGPEDAALALREPHTRPMDFTGRPMKSMLYVASEGMASDEQLRSWVHRALAYAGSLAPK